MKWGRAKDIRETEKDRSVMDVDILPRVWSPFTPPRFIFFICYDFSVFFFHKDGEISYFLSLFSIIFQFNTADISHRRIPTLFFVFLDIL